MPKNEDLFTRIAFGALTILIASGVVGVWSMSVSLNRLEERVAIWTQVGDQRMAQLNARVDVVERNAREAELRIGVLEGADKRN